MTREEAIDIFKHITTIIPSQDVTMDDVDTALAMAISALEQDRPIGHWISVKDKLPAERTHVIVCLKDGYVTADDYFCYGFDDFSDDVVAWMPTPEPYKGETKETIKEKYFKDLAIKQTDINAK